MTKAFYSDKERKDMMELWKETFHDSNPYIQLVFDTYYRPENAFTVYDGERLIASLLGVEYEFQRKDNEGRKESFKGFYLCGLATHPAYRRRGIMGELMKQAEESAKRRGFAIAFLIPADDHLRRYYERKGYTSTSFRMQKPIKKVNYIGKSKLYIYTFRELFELGKNDFIREVAEWCRSREKESRASITILHSHEDMMAAIRENENSFFLTNDAFDLKYPILAKVRAVVFPSCLEDDPKEKWSIDGLFLKEDLERSSEIASITSLPDEIAQILQEKFPDREFVLRLPVSDIEKENVEIMPYAMIKSIEKNDEIAKFENPFFKIYLMLD